MDRKEFFQKSASWGLCACALAFLKPITSSASEEPSSLAPPSASDTEKEFIIHWMNDLMDTMDQVLDRETKIKLIEGCGKSCFNRHQFKKDIAIKGEGSLDKLMEAYKSGFEIWKDNDKVHIRYGEVSQGCYCPAAKTRPIGKDDVFCECTRSTHQTIFETALKRPFKVEVLESVRRGGKTCHFLVHLS